MSRKVISVAGLCFSVAQGALGYSFESSSYKANNVISRDVVIIGGGAAGSYAAVQLAQQGKTVALVEKDSILGGHVDTYTDPATGTIIDYGVKRYGNIAVSTDFFDAVGVKYTANVDSATYNSTIYIDFKTAKPLDNFTLATDLTAYIAQLEKYPYLLWTNNIPKPVPSDLYLPVGDFITKYSLEDLAFTVFYYFGTSSLDIPTLNVINEFGLSELSASSAGSALHIEGGNQEIYTGVLSTLGSDVFLNSTVVAAQRNSSEVRLVVWTPDGYKLIVASQLLITMPTVPDNMNVFNLDAKESKLFNQMTGRGFWVGLVRITGLTPGVQYVNAGTDTLYHIPTPPAVNFLIPTELEGLYLFYYFADQTAAPSQARTEAVDAITSFVNGVSPSTTNEIELVAFSSHSPFRANFASDQIAQGYWADLYALQGHRNTWYTGCEFLAGSTAIWNYTLVEVLPKILAAL